MAGGSSAIRLATSHSREKSTRGHRGDTLFPLYLPNGPMPKPETMLPR